MQSAMRNANPKRHFPFHFNLSAVIFKKRNVAGGMNIKDENWRSKEGWGSGNAPREWKEAD